MPHVCACPKPGLRFPTSYFMVFLIVERGKIAANIHDHSLSWLGTDTSIKKIAGL
jgi:hypothetical protein